MLEKASYAVKIFDLIRLKNSDRFNPFHYMKSELDIDRISEAITEERRRVSILERLLGSSRTDAATCIDWLSLF